MTKLYKKLGFGKLHSCGILAAKEAPAKECENFLFVFLLCLIKLLMVSVLFELFSEYWYGISSDNIGTLLLEMLISLGLNRLGSFNGLCWETNGGGATFSGTRKGTLEIL